MNLKSIKTLYARASNEALIQLKHEARCHLRVNDNLNEFVMGMGTYMFVDNDGEVDYDCVCENVDTIIKEFDNKFKLTGYPIRFTTEGEEINDW